jgi:DNA primase catalytic core
LGQVAEFYWQGLYQEGMSAIYPQVYFAGRTYRYKTLKAFGASYTDGKALLAAAKTYGWSEDTLIATGLLTQKEERRYDFFYRRHLVTIHDHRGRVCGFAGRTISTDPKVPKYLNPKESLAYQKDQLLFGLFQGKQAIARQEMVILVEGYTDVMTMHEHGFQNTVASCGTSFTSGQAKLLKRYTNEVLILRDGDEAGTKAAKRDVEICVELGLMPKVCIMEEGEDPDSFLRQYGAKSLKAVLESDRVVDGLIWRIMLDWSSTEIFLQEKCYALAGRLLAYCNASLREIYLRELTKNNRMGRVKSILKDKIAEAESDQVNKKRDLTPDQEEDILMYGIFEKNNRYYLASSIDGDFQQISNFVIRPLMLVIGSQVSRRVMEIANTYGRSFTIMADSKELTSFQKFKEVTEGMGNYIFSGKAEHYEKLKAKLYNDFRDAFPINVMGQHKDGFYSWGNGISINGKFIPVDEYGIVCEQNVNYFLPAHSRIKENLRGDDMEEEYEFEKKFSFYSEPSTIDFEEWTRRMYDVFGHAGMMGVSFYISSLFRDIIFGKFGFFPLLNAFGPSGSGKSYFCRSIMAMFGKGKHHDPFNLASGTPVAFKRKLAQVSNACVWFDEYSNSIDHRRVEALKGSYDGAGHERGIASQDNRTKSTKVKSALLLSGQEQPTQDIALFKRCISLNFKAGRNTTDRQQIAQQLKDIEATGVLTQITQELLSYRSYINDHFSVEFERIRADMQHIIRGGDFFVEDRLVNNHLIPLTVLSLMYSKLSFGFRISEMIEFTKENIIAQSNAIFSEDELSIFWRIVDYLVAKRILNHQEDIMVQHKRKETVMDDKNRSVTKNTVEKKWDEDRKLLYIRFTKAHPEYQERHQRQRGKNGLDQNALQYYLEQSPAYVGRKNSKKFGDTVARCYVFDMEHLPLEIPSTYETSTP